MPVCTLPDMISTFTGNAVLRTNNGSAPGPFNGRVNLTAEFTNCRTKIAITSFQPIVTEPYFIDIPLLGRRQNITTVTRINDGSSGAFNPPDGHLEMPITLHFQHSLEGELGRLLTGPSDLRLTLTGGMSADGNVVLTGSGRFTNGFLGGSTGSISITNGRFSPRP
jgi:hypothetical protein